MNNFTGEFAMRDSPVTSDEMPGEMSAQSGMGDVGEEFRAVTRGLESMHRGLMAATVRDPILELDPDQDYDDIQRDAREAAEASVQLDWDDREFDVAPPGDAELDVGVDEFDLGGEL